MVRNETIASMWLDIRKLLWLAWHNALSAGSSTGISVFWLGFGVLALGFVFTVGLEWLFKGCNVQALKQAIKSWISWVGACLALSAAWILLFGYSVVQTIYADHKYLASDKRALTGEVEHWKRIAERPQIPPDHPNELPTRPISPKQLPAPKPKGDAKFSVSQKTLTTTRTDAPNHIRVVVQTTDEFPSLKFILKCTQPIVEAGGGVRANLFTNQGSGINPNDKRFWMFTYGSSFPPFGPDNPMVIDVWSASPNECREASTY